MNRRDFIKCGSFFLAATSIKNLGLNNFLLTNENFSIELITDNSDKAIKLIEQLIKNSVLNSQVIKFTELEFSNPQFGDIVFIKNKQLINYKTSTDELCKKFQLVAKELELPKLIDKPIQIKFYTQSDLEAKNFYIFHKNKLINKFSSESNFDSFNINGTNGYVTLKIENAKAKVIDASCKYKTCTKMHRISKSGEYIACIPNEIQIIGD